MRLYHGSENRIEKPVFGYGKKYNDYGLGFYCTESAEMAKEWAVGADRNGFANEYELDMEGLTVLNLNDPQFCILHWLSVLLQNREFEMSSLLAQEAKDYLVENFTPDYQSYDVIVGYRADDSYFSFAQDFISGTISYRQLSNAMHLGKLGQQVVLKSEKAFEQLTFVNAKVARAEEWFAKKQLRDKSARAEYFNSERNKRRRGDLFITQIMDEEMKADDERLRQNLS
ncbi:MAG: DUF3990 domain-containing protein [Pseudobutyrivibrio sp.]|nr:DUF3990 domain-containing protein [Pseudobutyrivibrio sp.]